MERTPAIQVDGQGQHGHGRSDHQAASAEVESFLFSSTLSLVDDGGAVCRAPAEPRAICRAADLVIATLMLLLAAPLVAACAIIVAFSGPGPVLFRQTRIGLYGREFTCFKFRTMVVSAESIVEQVLSQSSNAREEWTAIRKLRGDPRVTRAGQFMRRYSLDELPQLFNVLRGDMSVVGPRPIVAEEIHKYGPHFDKYCSVKPGLTGLWQVSGHHTLSYDKRVSLDAEYSSAKSLRLDLFILWRTVPIVLSGRNE